jgi:hypothetical protein
MKDILYIKQHKLILYNFVYFLDYGCTKQVCETAISISGDVLYVYEYYLSSPASSDSQALKRMEIS